MSSLVLPRSLSRPCSRGAVCNYKWKAGQWANLLVRKCLIHYLCSRYEGAPCVKASHERCRSWRIGLTISTPTSKCLRLFLRVAEFDTFLFARRCVAPRIGVWRRTSSLWRNLANLLGRRLFSHTTLMYWLIKVGAGPLLVQVGVCLSNEV